MTIFGWDASDYDWSRGPMDLAAAKAAGIVFFTHKSTETTASTTFKHKNFGLALNRAKAAGIPFYGTYVVPRSGVSIATQCENAVAYWDQQIPWWRTDPNFFIQVDLEKWPYDSVADSVGEAMARAFEPIAPTAVLLYGSKGMYGSTIDAGFLKWNANYAAERSPTREFKSVYAATGGDNGPGWAPYGQDNSPAVVWQYASDTTIGSQPMCDANAFKGTVEDFARMIKGSVPGVPPVQTTPPVVDTWKPVTVWGSVRVNAVGLKLIKIMGYYPKASEIYITSGMDGDHGSASFHYGNIPYKGSAAAAIDIGFGGTGNPVRGRDVAKWLYDKFADLIVEEIHTTPFSDDQGFYVKNQIRYPGGGPYSGATAAAHRDHVHFACSDALADQILAKLKPVPVPVPIPVPPVDDSSVREFDMLFAFKEVSAATVFVGNGLEYRAIPDWSSFVSLVQSGALRNFGDPSVTSEVGHYILTISDGTAKGVGGKLLY